MSALIRRGRPWRAASLANGQILLTPVGLIEPWRPGSPEPVDDDRPVLGVLRRLALAEQVERRLNGKERL